MKLVVLAVGRLKEPHWRGAQDEYLERLRHYCTPDIKEVADDAALAAAVPARATIVVLDERGESLTSEDWAAKVVGEAERRGGPTPLVFVVGGADGVPPALRAKAWKVLSFGKATMGHRLARIVLLEQVYRAFTILRGEPYHRGH